MPRSQTLSPSVVLGPPLQIPPSIHLYGWHSRTETWYGPNELGSLRLSDARLLQSLRSVSGGSWYGSFTCTASEEPASRFFTLVHRLADCATASIYCHESKAGPAELLVVIPPASHGRLREEFAFEFLAYARFLGVVSAGAELQVHEAIASAIAARLPEETVVFSLNSGLWPDDLEHVLSCCIEKLAVTLTAWLDVA
jgi:hypothetical protein